MDRLATMQRHRIDCAWCSLSPSGDRYKSIQINGLMTEGEILSLFGDEAVLPAMSGILANALM